MNSRDTLDLPPSLDLPRSGREPVFTAPWQASAFALVVSLHRVGIFSWSEWVDMLSGEIKGSPQQSDETSGDAYYRQWLAALERITVQRGIVAIDELTHETGRWRKAYESTPHGHPVVLAETR